MSNRIPVLAVALVASAGLASAVSAQVVLTFNYTDLNGSYSTANSTFTAVASNTPALQSSGNVSRLLDNPSSTAVFNAGFEGGSAANAQINISVFNIMGTLAQGAGSIVLTDTDGDTISMGLSGFWVRQSGGRTFFNGNITNAVFGFAPGSDNVFTGQTGSFNMNFAAQQPLTGALIQLFVRSGVGFFAQDFTGQSTQVAGQLVPTPAAAALMGLGGLAAARRRRR